MTTGTAPLSSAKAFELFTESPRYRYRGCAPDVDDPSRAAGDLSLSRNAWISEDRDGAEPQREREAREAAAIDVCVSCPVMVLCDQYASSARPDGRLAEPRWIWGGRTALKRRQLFEQREKPPVVVRSMARTVPVERLKTPQKQAVLRALAVCWDPFEVAGLAGVDVRTANWQRSRIVSDLGLPKTASRARVLAVAGERGLLEGVQVVPDDGSVLAVAPPTKTKPAAPTQPTTAAAVVPEAVPVPVVVPAGASLAPVQLSLEDILALDTVTELFPDAVPLGAAA